MSDKRYNITVDARYARASSRDLAEIALLVFSNIEMKYYRQMSRHAKDVIEYASGVAYTLRGCSTAD